MACEEPVNLKLIQTLTSIFTGIIAFLAYRIGRQYFDRGQSNIISLEHYRRELDVLNSCESHLREMVRLAAGLFSDQSKTETGIQGILIHLADNHERLSDSTNSAMFIPRMSEIRSLYLEWYDTWFVNADDGLMSLAEEVSRDRAMRRLESLKKDLDIIVSKLVALKKSTEPDLRL